MAADQVDTIVGANAFITGSVRNKGSIQVHGTVVGDIQSDASVFIAETAKVEGPVTAKMIEVAGHVEGSLTGESGIDLLPKSVVKGDVTTQQLSIRAGAIFVGSSHMHLPEVATEEDEAKSPKRKPRLEIE